MNVLNAIFFQLRCLLLGIGTDVENFAGERAVEPITNLELNTANIAPKIGRGDLATEIGSGVDIGNS